MYILQIPRNFFKASPKTLPHGYFSFFTIVKFGEGFQRGGGGSFSNHLKNIHPWWCVHKNLLHNKGQHLKQFHTNNILMYKVSYIIERKLFIINKTKTENIYFTKTKW